ncbi:uncharacterized protein C8Q71DRAFT_74273 [Rhodofomes roseus]|uniref:Uncharacterized protein n=1 Tax=Rhodofomes roseus TaxID=34475 RepID=A0ABQ8KEX4_9APHY|nr:uncharacterized protein C8Q71DRAFT_74273 [Rhodofomes roseus]KAH9836262.1 hypothetical protein C8Q71DRAFT_74273 [Rhodofomes roseus]
MSREGLSRRSGVELRLLLNVLLRLALGLRRRSRERSTPRLGGARPNERLRLFRILLGGGLRERLMLRLGLLRLPYLPRYGGLRERVRERGGGESRRLCAGGLRESRPRIRLSRSRGGGVYEGDRGRRRGGGLRDNERRGGSRGRRGGGERERDRPPRGGDRNRRAGGVRERERELRALGDVCDGDRRRRGGGERGGGERDIERRRPGRCVRRVRSYLTQW